MLFLLYQLSPSLRSWVAAVGNDIQVPAKTEGMPFLLYRWHGLNATTVAASALQPDPILATRWYAVTVGKEVGVYTEWYDPIINIIVLILSLLSQEHRCPTCHSCFGSVLFSLTLPQGS